MGKIADIKRTVGHVLACMLVAGIPSLASAFDVAVVRNIDIRPYAEVLEGFRNSCGCTIREINITGSDRSGVVGRIEETTSDAVLAIGADALSAVRGVRRPLYYAMVLPSPGSPAINASGVSILVNADLYFTHIATLFPEVKRVGMLYDSRATSAYIRAAGEAARAHGLELVAKDLHRAKDLQPALESLRERIDILLMIPDTIFVNSESMNAVLLFSFQNRIPLFSFSKKHVEMGALAALNISGYDVGAQAGELVRTHFPPGREPLRIDARKAALLFNRKIAQKLGIRVREQGLREAEEAGPP